MGTLWEEKEPYVLKVYARWIGKILSRNNLNQRERIETMSKLLESINVVAKVIEENRR
jgi:starvation-inducible outer membrane lipoprotein